MTTTGLSSLLLCLTTLVASTLHADVTNTAASTQRAAQDCAKNVVLTGYWPPTNEMLRPWSTDLQKNPQGWTGRNWGNYGFDVYAFFPEFPPDGDPMNDPFGTDGWIGSPDSVLRVDYQHSSVDFWQIVDRLRPHVLVTTSRGGALGWEIEAVEGGHDNATDDPANDWLADGHGEFTLPERDSIAPRSWAAISEYRRGRTLASQLPMQRILAATQALQLTEVGIDPDGTSGRYLSGFMGLHGLYYNSLNAHVVAAGHIHVGIDVPVENAQALLEASLHSILQPLNPLSLDCPR